MACPYTMKLNEALNTMPSYRYSLHSMEQSFIHTMIMPHSCCVIEKANSRSWKYLIIVKFSHLPTFFHMRNWKAHTLESRRNGEKMATQNNYLLSLRKFITVFSPQSFPVYAIQAKAVRLSAEVFRWLKKSDRLPSVNAFAFIITSFNGLRNSAKPARSGFCMVTQNCFTALETQFIENRNHTFTTNPFSVISKSLLPYSYMAEATC